MREVRRHLLYMPQHCARPPIAASPYARTPTALAGEAAHWARHSAERLCPLRTFPSARDRVPSVQFRHKAAARRLVVQSEHYTDFDAFAATVGEVDGVMLLQNPRRHSWSLSSADVSGVHIQLGRLGSGNIFEGQSRADGTVFYLPLTDTCTYLGWGKPIEKDAVMIAAPSSAFLVSTKFEHDWCSIFVPTVDIAGNGDRDEASLASEKVISQITRPNRQTAGRFRRSVSELMSVAAKYPQFESSLASTAAGAGLRQLTNEILVQPQASELHRGGRPRVPRREIIRRSLELLEEQSREPVVVVDLAAAAGVSERTLRTVFQERYGVGPARYLQLRHLHQVRRALRAADPEEVTVADVLLQHGEWQFGRFAARYRRLFGELPSETLRARRPIVQVPPA
jgi:AraC family ethanolamine operon transcriptional activator